MSNYFDRAQLLYEQCRYNLAIQELQQALAIQPDNASCHRLLALCLSQQRHYPAAIVEIDQAIHLSPNYAGAYYIKAGILRDQGKLTSAREAVSEALRLDPKDTDYHARLAAIQYDQDQIKAALVSAEQGLQLNAEHPGCMNLRMLSLLQLGRLDEAEADVQSALAAVPDNHFAHAVYGWISLRRSHIPVALGSFQEALRLKPDFELARRGLVEALKARNGFYRFILSVERWRFQMTVGSRKLLLLIPQIRALYWLLVFIVALSKPIFTFLLSLDAYGKLTLTSAEIRKNGWIMAGLLIIILAALLCCLI